jgi:hypothetical protein
MRPLIFWLVATLAQAESLELAETRTKENLSALRASLTLFLEEKKDYPSQLQELVPTYFTGLPTARVGELERTSRVTVVRNAKGRTPSRYVKETGGWLYFAGGSAFLRGKVFVDSTAKSSEGKRWYRY